MSGLGLNEKAKRNTVTKNGIDWVSVKSGK